MSFLQTTHTNDNSADVDSINRFSCHTTNISHLEHQENNNNITVETALLSLPKAQQRDPSSRPQDDDDDEMCGRREEPDGSESSHNQNSSKSVHFAVDLDACFEQDCVDVDDISLSECTPLIANQEEESDDETKNMQHHEKSGEDETEDVNKVKVQHHDNGAKRDHKNAAQPTSQEPQQEDQEELQKILKSLDLGYEPMDLDRDVEATTVALDHTTHHVKFAERSAKRTQPTNLAEAGDYVQDFVSTCTHLGECSLTDLPVVDLDEIIPGRCLGRGGFSHVEEIRHFQLPDGRITPPPKRRLLPIRAMSLSELPAEERLEMHRNFLFTHCLRESGESRYAIKRLRKDVCDNETQFPLGVMDLVIEALFLANLQHPHIMKLRAISHWDMISSIQQTKNVGGNHFLVLDRLYDTLKVRIEKWKERKRKNSTWAGRVRDVRGKRRRALLEERLVKAYDLSAALMFLQQNRIVHRDLKGENIGFDVRGDIKIFDFGLARELCERDKDIKSGMYHLSSLTGSLRYMAPEVAMGKPYNEKCDIYSFSILLYEMLALQRGFASLGTKLSQEKFAFLVFHEMKRPPVRLSWPRVVRELVQQGWAHAPGDRPSAALVHSALRRQLVDMRHGDSTGLEHKKRRSTFLADESMRDAGPENTYVQRRNSTVSTMMDDSHKKVLSSSGVKSLPVRGSI